MGTEHLVLCVSSRTTRPTTVSLRQRVTRSCPLNKRRRHHHQSRHWRHSKWKYRQFQWDDGRSAHREYITVSELVNNGIPQREQRLGLPDDWASIRQPHYPRHAHEHDHTSSSVCERVTRGLLQRHKQ